MDKIFTKLILVFLFLMPLLSFGQKLDRIQVIQQKLDELANTESGLNQPVRMQVSGASIHDYLNALSKANNFNISVDPKLNFSISETLNNVTASNIITFLAKKYNLDINVDGTIIYVILYDDPSLHVKLTARELKIRYEKLPNTLSMELNNDSLTAVAKKITDLSGKNVIVPASLIGKKVNGFFSGADFDGALEKLAYTNEIKLTKTADNFYLFQPLEENEELYVNGDKNTASRKTFKPLVPATGAAGRTGLLIKTVNGEKLISLDAVNAPILDLIKQVSQELNKNYLLYPEIKGGFDNGAVADTRSVPANRGNNNFAVAADTKGASDVKGTITIHINDVSYENFLKLMLKGTDYTYHLENGNYIIGDSKMEGLRASKFIQLKNRSIDSVIDLVPVAWKKEVEIQYFKEQNALIISGSNAHIAEIETFMKNLDMLIPNVLIEVTLVDINKTRSISTGISAGVADSVKTGGTVLPGVNFTFSASSVNSFLSSISSFTSINLGHVVPNFYVSLQALEANSNIDVRSVPKLAALNGHSATMSVGSSVFYKNTTSNVIPSSATSTTILANTYVESKADLSIAIRPMVSGDDQVTLGIKIEVSDFTSIPTDGSPPPKATSKFESSIRVNNEDMIVLGGIERNERDDSASGIPILSRIPILKWIFSSKTKTTKKVVTMVFIKPTILR